MKAPADFDLDAELDRLRRADNIRRFEGFEPRALTWFAALPVWTDTLAAEAGLGGGRETVTELVGRLKAADLTESREVLGPEGQRQEAFWVRASIRPDIGRYLQRTQAERLERDLEDLADAVDRPGFDSLGLSAWRLVVRRFRREPSGLDLIREIDRLVNQGRLSEATSLVGAARGVGEVTGGPLADASRRAQWRIDRALREEQDRRHLLYYSHRRAVEDAVGDLMLRPGGHWALHLLGGGGVGKTMLIRYLASGRFAADRGVRPFPVARADFDHLDPRYPEQRPAELFLALAGELLTFGRTRDLSTLYRRFRDSADALHEALAGSRVNQDEQEKLLRDTARQFARFIGSLESPVLLVVDTCEEIAKLYTPGASAPAIDRTFRMMELLRAEKADFRVLLAGRRWLVPPPDDRDGTSCPVLRPRPYVRVCRVRGFTKAEADAYLDLREARSEEAPDSPPLRPGLRTALLNRAAERSSGGRFYNPFDLAAYADWAASEPDLDPRSLRSAKGDPYVEWRIIGRLGDHNVRAALGIAAEFGRFDRALISPALARARIDPEAAFPGLAAQEWVNVLSLGEDGRPDVIEIDEHLRDRIRKVTAAHPEQFPLDRPQLGQDARRVIERTPLPALPAETVEAAVRMLPVETAAVLWQRIESRVVDEHAWAWAAQITRRVGEAEARRTRKAGQGNCSILGAIFATQAAACLHTRTEHDLPQLWRQVELQAPRHPDPGIRAALELRARLGRLAAGEGAGTGALSTALRLGDAERQSLAGAIVAAAEACTARGEALDDDAALLRRLAADPQDPAIGATALLTCSVLELWAGRMDDAASDADAAIDAARQAARAPERSWADWVPPRRLVDRCRLVRLLVARRRGEGLHRIPWEAWRAEALRHGKDIDAERLAGATIRFELGHRLVPAKELELIEAADRYVAGRQPSAWAHHQVRPLAVELAEAWSILGEPERAADLLRRRSDAAVRSGEDPDTIEACELELLRLCRRYRTMRYFSSVQSPSRHVSPGLRAEAWRVRTLVAGEPPASPEEAGSWHIWWQCQDAVSLRAARAAPPPPRDEPGVPAAAAEADRREFASFFPDAAEDSPSGDENAPEWHQLDIDDQFRAGHARTLPPGALGRAAVSVAEMTALRFPARAAEQLREAAAQLRAAGDDLGAEEATLLAALAKARAGIWSLADCVWSALSHAPGTRLLTLVDQEAWAGWAERVDVMRRYAGREPAALIPSASPETRLPDAGSRTRVRTALHRLTLTRVPEEAAVALGGGLAVVGGAVAAGVGTSDPALPAAVAALLVIIRLLTAWLPHGFSKARSIVVGRITSERARLTTRRWRGVADLNGWKWETIAGTLTGRWPIWSGFASRRLSWSGTISPDDPAPRVDLGGLRLPTRFGVRTLTLIEMTIPDEEFQLMPWESWLGASASADQARIFLWFRRIPGRPPAFKGRSWKEARAVYRGPRHIAQTAAPYEPGMPALRLLHVVATPVRTNAGWRLRVADALGALSSTPSRGTAEGEELLRIDEFPLRRTALAVLQAEPADEGPTTLGDLRSSFTGCARDLLDGGVGAVLIIPPLSDELSGEVVTMIRRAIADRRNPPLPTTLLRLMARLKALVADAEQPADPHERPALDVLLFLRGHS